MAEVNPKDEELIALQSDITIQTDEREKINNLSVGTSKVKLANEPSSPTKPGHAISRLMSGVGTSAKNVVDNMISNDMKQSGIITFQNGILHPYSVLRIRWDVLIGVIICIQAFTIPLRVGFQLFYVPVSIYVIDRLVDVIFITDIFINFNTGFVTMDGLVECDKFHCRIHYFKTWFFWDLISSIPYELMFLQSLPPGLSGSSDPVANAGQTASSSLLRGPQLLRTFKIMRIFKLLKLIRLVRLRNIMVRWEKALFVSHSVSSLAKFVCFVVFVSHWIACLFFGIAAEYVEYGPPNWIIENNMLDASLSEQYVIAFYWSISTVTTIGFGDIVPTNSSERLVSVVAMIFGCVVFAYGITHILNLMNEINRHSENFRESMDELNNYMRYRRLPPDLRAKIREYMHHTYSQKRSRRDFLVEDKVLKDLSPSIRQQVIHFVNLAILDTVPIFHEMGEAALAALIKVMTAEFYAPGDEIVKEGDIGTRMYILAKGQVEVLRWDSFRVAVLTEGQYFGEMAVLSTIIKNRRRTATVKALTYCDVRCIKSRDVKTLLEEHPIIREKLEERTLERKNDLERLSNEFEEKQPRIKALWEAEQQDKYLWGGSSRGKSSRSPKATTRALKKSSSSEKLDKLKNSQDSSRHRTTSAMADEDDELAQKLAKNKTPPSSQRNQMQILNHLCEKLEVMQKAIDGVNDKVKKLQLGEKGTTLTPLKIGSM